MVFFFRRGWTTENNNQKPTTYPWRKQLWSKQDQGLDFTMKGFLWSDLFSLCEKVQMLLLHCWTFCQLFFPRQLCFSLPLFPQISNPHTLETIWNTFLRKPCLFFPFIFMLLPVILEKSYLLPFPRYGIQLVFCRHESSSASHRRVKNPSLRPAPPYFCRSKLLSCMILFSVSKFVSSVSLPQCECEG